MEKLRTFWSDHTPTGHWALGWLAAHLVIMGLVTASPVALQRIGLSTLAVALCYALARRGHETIAAVSLCVVLSANFHLSAIANYSRGDLHLYSDNLVVFSAIVLLMAGHTLGRQMILITAAGNSLILLVSQARLGADETIILYLVAAAGIYYHRSQQERQTEPHKPQGLITRHIERGGYIAIRLETVRGEVLQVRVAKAYWATLGLNRGNRIIIDQYEIRAENGRQYIQAFVLHSIRKVDQSRE